MCHEGSVDCVIMLVVLLAVLESHGKPPEMFCMENVVFCVLHILQFLLFLHPSSLILLVFVCLFVYLVVY